MATESSGNMQRRQQLEFATSEMLDFLKGVDCLKAALICVIGGLAVSHYADNDRKIKGIDFYIDINPKLESLENKLLSVPDTPFSQGLGFLSYTTSDGDSIPFNFHRRWKFPGKGLTAQQIQEIPDGHVPYIPLTDLIVSKIYSSGLRQTKEMRKKDAADGRMLAEKLPEYGPLRFSNAQKESLKPVLCDEKESRTPFKAKWRLTLGIPHPKKVANAKERVVGRVGFVGFLRINRLVGF